MFIQNFARTKSTFVWNLRVQLDASSNLCLRVYERLSLSNWISTSLAFFSFGLSRSLSTWIALILKINKNNNQNREIIESIQLYLIANHTHVSEWAGHTTACFVLHPRFFHHSSFDSQLSHLGREPMIYESQVRSPYFSLLKKAFRMDHLISSIFSCSWKNRKLFEKFCWKIYCKAHVARSLELMSELFRFVDDVPTVPLNDGSSTAIEARQSWLNSSPLPTLVVAVLMGSSSEIFIWMVVAAHKSWNWVKLLNLLKQTSIIVVALLLFLSTWNGRNIK